MTSTRPEVGGKQLVSYGTKLLPVAITFLMFCALASAQSMTSLTPNTGPVGARVTIAGTGFGNTQGSGLIKFQGITASIISWNSTQIVCTVPSGVSLGAINAKLWIGSTGYNELPFTVTSPPSITSLSSTSGPVGTPVTITGSNFGSALPSSVVTFNGTTATVSAGNWTATSITTTVPSGATTGNVVVSLSGVASNPKTFTVTNSSAPSITSVSVSSGPVSTSVTITGTNFGASQGTSTVTFNGTTATVSAGNWSATSIITAVPSGATTGNVVVTVGGVASNSKTFTVTPHINSMSTNSGPVGTPVTITGTTFGSTQGTVTFNGTTAPVSSWNLTSITVTVPSGATSGNVVVTASGQGSNGVPFTVTGPAPAIASISPNPAPVGRAVYIKGSNFGSSGTVTFGGVTATTTSWSSTLISAVVPSGAPTGNVVVTVAGQASGAYSFTVGNAVENLVTSTSYDMVAYKTTVSFGSGDSDVYTYDSNTGRMTQYQFNVGGQTIVGSMSWNQNGSLGGLNITDPLNSANTQNCTYAHDDLARIGSVNCVNGSTNVWNQTFAYDAFGNISKTSTGPGVTFPGSLPAQAYSSSSNWLKPMSGCTPTYDNVGDMTNDCVHNYGWDAEGKMISVDTNTTIVYDAFGRIVEKSVSGTVTQIVYGPTGAKMAIMSGQVLQKGLVQLPAGATAVYTSTGLVYRHSDHLGSSRLATTSVRTMYSSTAYAPYGEAYAQAGTTDLSFTGQDQDTVAGLHDFMDRRYSPGQGRWMSPDPMGIGAVNPANPQSWNRYAYVMNNPLALIDPLGDQAYEGCGNGSYFTQGCGQMLEMWSDPFSFLSIPFVPVGAIFVDGGCIGCTNSFLLVGTDPTSTFPPGIIDTNPPMPNPPPIYCRADVISAMKKSWAQTQNGTTGLESGFAVNGTPDKYSIAPQFTNESHHMFLTIQTKYSSTPTFALFHVHPGSGRSGMFPSTPDNNWEGNKLGDTGVADKYGFQTYVMSAGGLTMYDPATGKVTTLRENLDWTKPCTN